MQHFYQSVYDLIVETSTNLPGDVRRAVQAAQRKRGQRHAFSVVSYPVLLITFIWRNAMYPRFVRIRACQRLLYTVRLGQTKLS